MLALLVLATAAAAQYTGTLRPVNYPNKCVDVRAANFSPGAAVQVYDCNGTPAQQFTFSGGATNIKVAGRNLCLTPRPIGVGHTPILDGMPMELLECYDSSNPDYKNGRWVAANLGGDVWTFMQVPEAYSRGRVLDLTNGSGANGNQLQVWTGYSGNGNQMWKFVPSKC